jgi:hypothetical protein
MTQKQVFVSHSKKDEELVAKFKIYLERSKLKPVFMEFEEHSKENRADWEWIRDEIERSTALLLLLTKNVIAAPQTQNWIAFEVGVAAGCKPRKRVCVIREQHAFFPVPYLNVYIPTSYRLNRESQRFAQPEFDNFMKIVSDRFLGSVLIGEEKSFIGREILPTLTCPNCKLSFKMYIIYVRIIRCPCCSEDIKWNVENYRMRDTEGKFFPEIVEKEYFEEGT